MAIGREFYQLIRLYGGLALEYQNLIESDFTAVAGAAYSPPEEGVFRRIVGAREIQLLSQCPGVVETFQTSAATIRLPANTVAESTNDAANGRFIIVKNSGTGSLTIRDYLGISLSTVTASRIVIVIGNNNNTWDFLFDSGSSGGVTPPFIFSKSGGAGVGAYLKTGEVLTSKTGQLIKGSNYVVELNCSSSAIVSGTGGAVIKMQRRTGLATFVDIAGATVTVPSGSFSGSNLITLGTVSIGPNWEVSCYNAGPENLTDPVVTMFLLPQ